MHSHAKTSAKIDDNLIFISQSFLLFFLRKSRGEVLKKILTTDYADRTDDENDEDQRPANDANGHENSIKRKIICINSCDSWADLSFSLIPRWHALSLGTP
jgi:hypothetical protein